MFAGAGDAYLSCGVNLHGFIDFCAKLLEVAGVVILVGSAVAALGWTLWRVRTRGWKGAYSAFRVVLGRGILLGLELLVIADIILTITSELEFERVGALGLIVLIRTFLSTMVEVELEGRLPWKRHEHGTRRSSNAEVLAQKGPEGPEGA